ncbi:MAG: alpha/beta fold hydrolase [Candidatus Saccharibacteria bacterium]
MYDRFIHQWLNIPHTLYSRVISADKPIATVLFIHGIGNSGAVWDKVLRKLPTDIRIVTIDLLGFGGSSRPSWAIYSAKTQARSVLKTFFNLRLGGPVIVVGHSLGALVAVEMAKRSPRLVQSLILCSPPFYQPNLGEKRLFPRSDGVLKIIFKKIHQHPERFLQITSVAMRYKLINEPFDATKAGVDSYMGTLEAAIINQTSLEDVKKLQLPIHMIRGTFDPMVVSRNLKGLASDHPNVTVVQIAATHEVKGFFVAAVVKAIERACKVNRVATDS